MAQKAADQQDKATSDTAPSRDYAQEAKVALDADTRQAGAEKVLAEQLKQQDEAAGDVPDAVEQVEASRAAHQGEGGGPWPAELLARGTAPVGAVVSYAPEQNYTSHEDPPKA